MIKLYMGGLSTCHKYFDNVIVNVCIHVLTKILV